MTQGKSQVKVLSIKKFAEICHTTPRTLRFYEQKGLIKPYAIDPFTKYRSYDAREARVFLRIKLLQNFGIPLEQIQSLAKENNLNNELQKRLKQIKEEIKQKQKEYAFLQKINSFLFEEQMDTVFKTDTFGPYQLFCMKVTNADYKDMAVYQAQILKEAKQLKLPLGTEQLSFYMTTQYQPKGTTLELALPYRQSYIIKDELLTDGFYVRSFPKTKALVYTYTGPYEYFSIMYQKLFDYIEQNQIALSGNVFDVYKLKTKNLSKYEISAKLVFPIK